MSRSSLMVVSGRIDSATVYSPIAVFRTEKEGIYNAVFADTVLTANRIADGDSNLIGVFYGTLGATKFRDVAR